MLILTLFAGIGCQEPFTLAELVDGPDGKALTVSPTSAVLQVNDTLPVDTSGGIPPYTYSVIFGSGMFVGNLYTAPATAGTERIRVSDTMGNAAEAVYTINSAGLSLGITPASQTVYTGEGISFNPIGGTPPYTFSMTTINESNGSVSAAGAYVAGNMPGNDVIRVEDSTLSSATATVTVLAKPLAISPGSITVYVNQSIQFVPVGGDGGFSFGVASTIGSSINSSSGAYVAGQIPGTDTVTLTDAYDGRSKTATVYVVDVESSVDYEAMEVNGIVSADDLTGSSFDAKFSVVNNGSTGSRPINWTLYASTDDEIGGPDDRITAAGTLAGTAAGSTVVVPVTGALWPSEPGSYYLLVDVYAADDLNPDDNRNRSDSTVEIYAPLSITPAVASVYTGQQVDFTVSGGTGSYSYAFAQTGSGAPSISGDRYTAGSSSGTDILEVSDTLYPSWPATGATITVATAPPPPAGDVEYVVSSFSANNNAPDGGAAIGESFTLYNSGIDDGALSLNWAVYLSQDNSAGFSAGDQIIDFGYEASLDGDDGSAGGSDETTVTINGSWPLTAGTWYLKVKEWADDEVTPDEWFVSSPFTVQPPPVATVDYFISVPPAGGTGVILGDTVLASFTAGNQGGDAGSSPVSWWAYISADALFNAGDIQIDSGSFAALSVGGSSGSIPIDSGTWNSTGSWYLLVRLQAADEDPVYSANNVRPSSNVYVVSNPAATEPDYKVSSVSMYSPFVTGGSAVEESFTVGNSGTDGTENITWTAYASTDQVPDAGEEIGSGVIGPLTAGQTLPGITTFGALWPVAAGEYYLIVRESAADETTNPGDYAVSAGRFTVSPPPDYTIQSVTYPVSAEQNTPISGGFTIANSGSGDGKKNVTWEAYLSFDKGFSGDDLELGSGLIGPLESSETSLVLPSDLSVSAWPFYGRCYLLIRVSSDDDDSSVNNTYISPLTELYMLDREGPDNLGLSNDGSGPVSGTIANSQYIGSLKPGQTLVIRGWLDDSAPSAKYDTYAFDLEAGSGVGTVSTYAEWIAADDIGALYIWDELSGEFASTNNSHFREPAVGTLSVSGWSPPETGYVSISSYNFVAVGDEYPYTIYIAGRE